MCSPQIKACNIYLYFKLPYPLAHTLIRQTLLHFYKLVSQIPDHVGKQNKNDAPPKTKCKQHFETKTKRRCASFAQNVTLIKAGGCTSDAMRGAPSGMCENAVSLEAFHLLRARSRYRKRKLGSGVVSCCSMPESRLLSLGLGKWMRRLNVGNVFVGPIIIVMIAVKKKWGTIACRLCDQCLFWLCLYIFLRAGRNDKRDKA